MKKILLSLLIICSLTATSCTKNISKVEMYYQLSGEADASDSTLFSNMGDFSEYYKYESYQDSKVNNTYSGIYLNKKIEGTYRESTTTNEYVFNTYYGDKAEMFYTDVSGNIIYYNTYNNISELDVEKRDEAFDFALDFCKTLYHTCFELFKLTSEEQVNNRYVFTFGIVCGKVEVGGVSIGTNQNGELCYVDDRSRNNIEWFVKNKNTDFSKPLETADSLINEKLDDCSDFKITNVVYSLYLENAKNPLLRGLYKIGDENYIIVFVPID